MKQIMYPVWFKVWQHSQTGTTPELKTSGRARLKLLELRKDWHFTNLVCQGRSCHMAPQPSTENNTCLESVWEITCVRCLATAMELFNVYWNKHKKPSSVCECPCRCCNDVATAWTADLYWMPELSFSLGKIHQSKGLLWKHHSRICESHIDTCKPCSSFLGMKYYYYPFLKDEALRPRECKQYSHHNMGTAKP